MFFHALKILFQRVKFYFNGLKFYFNGLKILFHGLKKLFMFAYETFLLRTHNKQSTHSEHSVRTLVNMKSVGLLHDYLLSINDIQSLLQGAESLTVKIIDIMSDFALLICYGINSCHLCVEFASECLTAILHGDDVTAFCVGRDVDAEANDGACIDGFLVDNFA